MNYYKVLAKFGHVGKNKYYKKWIAVKAQTPKEASNNVKQMPRAKHHNKKVILQLIKITFNEYIMLLQLNNGDMYFKVHNSTDQKRYCKINSDDIVYEENQIKYSRRQLGQYKRNNYIEKETRKALRNKEYYD